MKYFYPAVFTFDSTSDMYDISFPDLPGCRGKAATCADAYAKAKETLGIYLWELEDKGIDAPEPGDWDMLGRESYDSQVCVIMLDMDQFRSYRAYKMKAAREDAKRWVEKAASHKRWGILSRVLGIQ
ncbi:MAG: type II toxin-antitoxin system HicB family antitoxin [Dialister sp.]|nr:type II toxin-antitoxin system HicB family antitoxin [Dialister sp.]